MFELVKQRMQIRSGSLRLSIESQLDRILQCWLLLAGLACAAHIAVAPAPTRCNATPRF